MQRCHLHAFGALCRGATCTHSSSACTHSEHDAGVQSWCHACPGAQSATARWTCCALSRIECVSCESEGVEERAGMAAPRADARAAVVPSNASRSNACAAKGERWKSALVRTRRALTHARRWYVTIKCVRCNSREVEERTGTAAPRADSRAAAPRAPVATCCQSPPAAASRGGRAAGSCRRSARAPRKLPEGTRR